VTTAPYNRIRVPGSEEWTSSSFELLTCESDWGDYKDRCDEERGLGRRHNHGAFHPDEFPCLVWSFNTYESVLQHLFLYASDAEPLFEALAIAPPPPPRKRRSLLAEPSS
jgi:hypothetical protein